MKKKLALTDFERTELKDNDKIFCTECGNELEVFGIEDGSIDMNAVKANFRNCKATGKFKGDVCSKLYIITDDDERQDVNI